MATLEERINEGQEAKRLLAEDSILSRAILQLERDYIGGWRSTDAADHLRREDFYNRLHVLIDVRDAIARLISDGVMAEREIGRRRSAAEQENG